MSDFEPKPGTLAPPRAFDFERERALLTEPEIASALRRRKPYFGPALAATQGPLKRKAYMRSLVEHIVRTKRKGSINVLEVGSWAGTSTVTWANAIKEFRRRGRVTCVDLWQPYFDLNVDTQNVYQEMHRAAQHSLIYPLFLYNLRVSHVESMVRVIRGDSREVLPTLAGEAFDIVFIDGAHVYDIVVRDIGNAKRLVVDGGILCGDDLELSASELDDNNHLQALSARKDYTLDPKSQKLYHPGVTQAVAEHFKSVSNFEGLWAVRRVTDQWQVVDLSGYEIRMPNHLCDFEYVEHKGDGVLVEVLDGFNIFRVGEWYLGIRQSVGPVDVSQGARQLAAQYPPRDIIFGPSLDFVLECVGHYRGMAKAHQVEVERRCVPGGGAHAAPAAGSAAEPSELVGDWGDFNLVRVSGGYLALAKSLGVVTIDAGGRELVHRLGAANAIFSATLDDLLVQVQLRHLVTLTTAVLTEQGNVASRVSNELPALIEQRVSDQLNQRAGDIQRVLGDHAELLTRLGDHLLERIVAAESELLTLLNTEIGNTREGLLAVQRAITRLRTLSDSKPRN